jgi:hypothetical protein
LKKNKKAQKEPGSVEWCKIVDAFQASAIAAGNDYKLKHLVEVFELSGELLTA